MQQNIRINPLKYPNVKCDKCGNETFVQAAILKRIPGLEVGAGAEDQFLDLPVYICAKCGEILARDKESYGLIESSEEVNEVTEERSSTILNDSVEEPHKITKLILD